jgi:hypothetical protein
MDLGIDVLLRKAQKHAESQLLFARIHHDFAKGE